MTNSQSELRHICNRLVKLENDKAEIAAEIAETKKRAKDDGFDTALITKTVRIMRMEAEKQKRRSINTACSTLISALPACCLSSKRKQHERPRVHGDDRTLRRSMAHRGARHVPQMRRV